MICEEIKLKIVQEVLSGRLSKEQARRIYKIKGKSSILSWMRKFAFMNPKQSFGIDPIPILQKMKDESKDIRSLKAEIKQLKAELKYSELKGRAYQIMVELAKEHYDIDLEKKYGAKQSINSKKKIEK